MVVVGRYTQLDIQFAAVATQAARFVGGRRRLVGGPAVDVFAHHVAKCRGEYFKYRLPEHGLDLVESEHCRTGRVDEDVQTIPVEQCDAVTGIFEDGTEP